MILPRAEELYAVGKDLIHDSEGLPRTGLAVGDNAGVNALVYRLSNLGTKLILETLSMIIWREKMGKFKDLERGLLIY